MKEKKEEKMNKNDRREVIIKKCKCPCSACRGKDPEMDPELIDELIKLEDRVQGQANINSGKRCPVYNVSVGGYPTSPHRYGLAVDITVDGIELIALAKICEKMAFARIGLYPNHVHLDVVSPNPSRFWLVKKYGQNPIYSGTETNLIKFLKKMEHYNIVKL